MNKKTRDFITAWFIGICLGQLIIILFMIGVIVG